MEKSSQLAANSTYKDMPLKLRCLLGATVGALSIKALHHFVATASTRNPGCLCTSTPYLKPIILAVYSICLSRSFYA